ncbi:hypothetical protein [Cellulomonas timonensis]|uniref:hypothetical protein n=1 Tax=Cellulomonas timonensis TaxID=1689271 RepID=UPI00082A7133|nr:hypothetical protein [Cellulomonas timonensis]
MGTFNTYVVAQWDRPLTELRANAALEHLGADEGFSWARADGRQCFAPEGEFYGGELLPPITEIEREVEGPVLGLGVASSHWEVAFNLRGAPCWIAAEGSDETPGAYFEELMTRHWGRPWQTGAAAALAEWVSPWAQVNAAVVAVTLTIPHLLAEAKLADLQRVLTLAPQRGHPWWSIYGSDSVSESDIPGALYAIDAYSLIVSNLVLPYEEGCVPGLALVFTSTGFGLWDRVNSAWSRAPELTYKAALSELAPLLVALGWSPLR